ncbi:MAG: hypothetical protein CVT95_01995 [Bacteroidetes bacterium HGW-Bacteroidetes-12]|jgi:type IX secretion system PorP/SprF family membrane protein|nr:MAG: hypothetical protein CVT95_01995 [Bacteroidetes bacterium HGW-Bacteroidetes-12]
MKKILLILTVLMTLQAFAQQDPQYSLYMFNPLGVNPGYAGSRDAISGVLLHRSQWVGLDGAPTTQVFTLHSPLKNQNMALGFQLINDNIGPRTTQDISLVYAYKIKLGRGKLAFGLRGGILNYQYDWAKIEYKDQDDAIPTTANDNFILPNFDFGIYYNTNKFYAGIALDHLNQAKYNLSVIDTSTSVARKYINLTMTAGRAFALSDNLTLKTSAILRGQSKQGHIDINGSLLIKNKFLVGLTLTHRQTFVFMTEINITKTLKMGYAYDYTATQLTNGSSHELFIGYDFNTFKSKVVSPRYF